MDLKETIPLMLSEDYKDRFTAEYQQLVIRRKKLSRLIDNWCNLSVLPKTPKELYILQLETMNRYISVLEVRAINESIALVRKEE